jgi:hypothetical protein
VKFRKGATKNLSSASGHREAFIAEIEAANRKRTSSVAEYAISVSVGQQQFSEGLRCWMNAERSNWPRKSTAA